MWSEPPVQQYLLPAEMAPQGWGREVKKAKVLRLFQLVRPVSRQQHRRGMGLDDLDRPIAGQRIRERTRLSKGVEHHWEIDCAGISLLYRCFVCLHELPLFRLATAFPPIMQHT